jgi:hypothetical protein
VKEGTQRRRERVDTQIQKEDREEWRKLYYRAKHISVKTEG